MERAKKVFSKFGVTHLIGQKLKRHIQSFDYVIVITHPLTDQPVVTLIGDDRLDVYRYSKKFFIPFDP